MCWAQVEIAVNDAAPSLMSVADESGAYSDAPSLVSSHDGESNDEAVLRTVGLYKLNPVTHSLKAPGLVQPFIISENLVSKSAFKCNLYRYSTKFLILLKCPEGWRIISRVHSARPATGPPAVAAGIGWDADRANAAGARSCVEAYYAVSGLSCF
jgi:hypothetical protein